MADIIPAVLGWKNPARDDTSLRLYALDKASNPRWDGPAGRTAETAICETVGAYEGDRFLIVHLGDRFTSEDVIHEVEDRVKAMIEELATWPQDDEPLAGLVRIMKWTDEDAPGTDAYDGSNAPPVRELTARERDVLCGLISDIYGEYRRKGELPRGGRVWLRHLLAVREAVDPRRGD